MFLSTLSFAPSHFSSLISPFLLTLHILVVCYIIIIYTLLPELESKGFQQTAYQHGVSCLDAMFSAYETLSYLTRNRNTVFQTFYDLEQATWNYWT